MVQPSQSKMILNMMIEKRTYQIATIAKSEKDFSLDTQLMAAAITITEMQFRSLLHRLAEYTYVFILILLGRDASSVSVGISQISIRHYVSLEGTTQFQSLISSMSAKKSLAACCKLIDPISQNSLDEVISLYNGNCTSYYRAELQRNLRLLYQFEHQKNRL